MDDLRYIVITKHTINFTPPYGLTVYPYGIYTPYANKLLVVTDRLVTAAPHRNTMINFIPWLDVRRQPKTKTSQQLLYTIIYCIDQAASLTATQSHSHKGRPPETTAVHKQYTKSTKTHGLRSPLSISLSLSLSSPLLCSLPLPALRQLADPLSQRSTPTARR